MSFYLLSDKIGYTPLHVAAVKGLEGISRRLVEQAIPLDARDNVSLSQLHASLCHHQNHQFILSRQIN